jgi:hypothetical protein
MGSGFQLWSLLHLLTQVVPIRLPQAPGFMTSLRYDRAHLHDLEIRAFDCAERMQLAIVPSRIGRAAYVPVRAVVGDDHSILLHRAENYLHRRRESLDVD